MDEKSCKLDQWRNYFRSSNSSIFELIEYAIMVAASDCPQEFRLRRDRIAERLFNCRLSRCFGCDCVDLAVPHKEEEGDGDEEEEGGFKGGFGSKESKVNSSSNDGGELNRVSNYSYDEAEALTEEIEEESQIIGEVLRIKGLLFNHQEESEGVLFESLRRLELMGLTVEILKATEIGKAVNAVKKHGSKQIRILARSLINGWKDMVDEWVNAAQAIAEHTPQSVNPSVVAEEEGLPSPPLDEGAFLATQTSIELSQFFDGMDDDGNPQNTGASTKNRESGRHTTPGNNNHERKQQKLAEANAPNDSKNQNRRPEDFTDHIKPGNDNFGPGRPPKLNSDHRVNGDNELHKRPVPLGVQKKPQTSQQEKPMYTDDFVRKKLEASGRNLQERYQQLENAKRQRTIQVMELHNLPKQGPIQRNYHPKPGMHHRHWATSRR